MTESPAVAPPALDTNLHDAIATADWQPLPRRGALLYAIGAGFAFAIPSGFGIGMLVSGLADTPRIPTAIAAGVAGLLLGVYVGLLRHRRIGWKLDADGFATRRGGLWRTETLVPVSRVQHLDLERGPLERKLGLATLVVHTAGTRMAAVKLPLLALDDAEALRAHLARQVEADDAL
ncbi:PH domain-containing protein [Pseudoxanthomonas daejeonensis]|uniref:PH domain-containing protein n=1 Tax=Pseudoxanthomonas daejeonensis TaxID=266062 RepID=UPI00192EF608|nr:PH domain-containing protein [Pseudoxanthomonas daejeonensis]UNK58894.1 PH domain-containing protein [Pseudoxanthomonas daejeonensis]